MNRILFLTLIFIITIYGCTSSSIEIPQESENLEEKELDSGIVQCPYGHRDSIIPIIYGYPREEDFQKSDSGLVALGGCELPENPEPWFCKIHQIAF